MMKFAMTLTVEQTKMEGVHVRHVDFFQESAHRCRVVQFLMPCARAQGWELLPSRQGRSGPEAQEFDSRAVQPRLLVCLRTLCSSAPSSLDVPVPPVPEQIVEVAVQFIDRIDDVPDVDDPGVLLRQAPMTQLALETRDM